MDGLTGLPLRELARLVRIREASSREVVQAFIDVTESTRGLNALVELDGEGALRQALLADEALTRGEWLGPLHGIPFSVKDCLHVEGFATTCGVPQRKEARPQNDATAVARLRNAGGIPLGKTNLPFLCSTFETDNEVHGRTLNPYDPTRSPGGSSGGEAALIASGGSPLGLGSDRGGSIRVPCHYCGIAGLKPTDGMVPTSGHFPPPLGPLAGQVGPMAKYVDDLAYVLPIISGPDSMDPSALPFSVGEPGRVVAKGLRLATFTVNNGIYESTQETIAAVEKAAHCLSDLGAEVTEDAPPSIDRAPAIMRDLSRVRTPEFIAVIMPEYLEAGALDPRELPNYADTWLERAKGLVYDEPMTSAEYCYVLNSLEAFRSRMLRFMKGYDAIICPVAGRPALPHGFTKGPEGHAFNNTWAFSLAGWPAAVARAGTSPEGLPIGVQVVARPGRDDVVLALAGMIEKGLGGYMPPT